MQNIKWYWFVFKTGLLITIAFVSIVSMYVAFQETKSNLCYFTSDASTCYEQNFDKAALALGTQIGKQQAQQKFDITVQGMLAPTAQYKTFLSWSTDTKARKEVFDSLGIEEGFRANCYKDSQGKDTQGFGSRYDLDGKIINCKTAKPITIQTASVLFWNHVDKEVVGLLSCFHKVSLPKGAYVALVSTVYNTGASGFCSDSRGEFALRQKIAKDLLEGDWSSFSRNIVALRDNVPEVKPRAHREATLGLSAVTSASYAVVTKTPNLFTHTQLRQIKYVIDTEMKRRGL